jgi:1,4-alpha-glucan branching enzyme
MPLGYLCLVLHAHLPYVRHPEYDDFLEEDWLYEAITETYIPLLDVFDGLQRDGVEWRLTMSVTPTLAAMLRTRCCSPATCATSTTSSPWRARNWSAPAGSPSSTGWRRMYHRRFLRAREVFVTQYGNNLLRGFRRFFEAGTLELITCGATHGFLPLMNGNDNAVRAQVSWAPASSSATSGGGRRGSGCPSAATPRASRRSCTTRASATSSPTRTASSTPRRTRSTTPG